MKTLQESIIGRKGTQAWFAKHKLRAGYIVKYRNNRYGEFSMYFGFEDIEEYFQDTETLALSHIIAHLRRHNDMGVFMSKEKHERYPSWCPLSYYSEDLCAENGGPDFDIVEVYPIKMNPEFLSSQELEKLVRNINPIKINQ